MAKLSENDRQKLAAILTEIKSRGLEGRLKDLKTFDTKSRKTFFTDENNYFIHTTGRHYNPNPTQAAYVASEARFVLLRGGRGSGKSSSSAQKALRRIAKGLPGAVLNPRFEDFKTSTWPEFRDWIPWENVIPRHRYRASPGWIPLQPFTLTFTNGAVVICKGLSDPRSARGPNINWLWYDEAGSDPDGMAWKIAIASVRVGKDPQAFASTTPKGKLHWVYDFFIKQDIPEEVAELFNTESGGRQLIDVFHASVRENLNNLDPGFVASLMTAYVKDSYLYKQEVDGDFVVEGACLGNRAWFTEKYLDKPFDVVKKRVRYWDLAASEKKITGKRANDPDETVGTKLSWDGELRFCIEHQDSGFWAWQSIKENIARVAQMDGVYVKIYVEQEPGAGGINQVEELKLYIRDNVSISHQVEGHRPEGDKVMRAQAWFAEASNGQFYVVRDKWNEGFLDQVDAFPEAEHDDKVDSVSGARQVTAPFKCWRNIEFIHL